jgi:hypothetical protein
LSSLQTYFQAFIYDLYPPSGLHTDSFKLANMEDMECGQWMITLH